MKLQRKLLIILFLIWSAVAFSVYLYSTRTLIRDYLKLEQQEVIEDINRITNMLNLIFSNLKTHNADWSQWDDTYQFMKNKNAAYIKSNITTTTFENIKINFMLFFSTDGNLFYGQEYDPIRKEFVSIHPAVIRTLQAEKKFTQVSNVESGKTGILKIADHYLIVSALPILTSDGKGPARGSMVLGYYLTDNQIKKLSQITNVQMQFFPLPLQQADPVLSIANKALQSGVEHYINAENGHLIYGFAYVYDIDNKPIGIIRLTSSRDLYNQGLAAIHSYLIITLAIGILFLIITWYLIKHFILSRIINASKQIIAINSESKFSNRIKTNGHDEFSQMIDAVNSMIEIIELSQSQLKYRIHLRTTELEQLSRLNKNLSTEMNRQKEIEARLREGEKMLKQMAYYDPLTGLPNRYYFNEILQKILSKAARDGSGVALLFLDADKFKSINDTFGHDIGDRYLKHVAQQLKYSIREGDVAARIAGDEFIICLTDIRGKPAISRVAQKILENVSVPLVIDNHRFHSTFSIGICVFPKDGLTADELEKHADIAMYHAKKLSGNIYCYYDEVNQAIISE